MRERFTPTEWATLEFLPLWVFTGVAGIDGNIDHDETKALARELVQAALYADPLARQVLTSVSTDLQEKLDAFAADPRSGPTGMQEATAVLDARLSRAEAKSFKTAMLHLGKIVAEASDGGVEGTERVSDNEKVVLGSLITILGL